MQAHHPKGMKKLMEHQEVRSENYVTMNAATIRGTEALHFEMLIEASFQRAFNWPMWQWDDSEEMIQYSSGDALRLECVWNVTPNAKIREHKRKPAACTGRFLPSQNGARRRPLHDTLLAPIELLRRCVQGNSRGTWNRLAVLAHGERSELLRHGVHRRDAHEICCRLHSPSHVASLGCPLDGVLPLLILLNLIHIVIAIHDYLRRRSLDLILHKPAWSSHASRRTLRFTHLHGLPKLRRISTNTVCSHMDKPKSSTSQNDNRRPGRRRRKRQENSPTSQLPRHVLPNAKPCEHYNRGCRSRTSIRRPQQQAIRLPKNWEQAFAISASEQPPANESKAPMIKCPMQQFLSFETHMKAQNVLSVFEI